MEFSASAPAKAILFGEHYVVYGSPSLAVAIEPRNAVQFREGAGEGIALSSSLGEGRIAQDGGYSGVPELAPYAAVAKSIFPDGGVPNCAVGFKPAWKLKGAGTSASLCAAAAAGLFKLAGKEAAPGEIFKAAQSGDVVAHGGKASGIDATTVSYGQPLVFQKGFQPPKFEFRPVDFSLPLRTQLVLIDTNKGKKDGTAKMVGAFAASFQVTTTPEQMPIAKRREIRDEFAKLWGKVLVFFKNPEAAALGSLMNENHALLKKRGVSSDVIETAISAALAAGAYGAKLTGAGGEGGAVIALVDASSVENMSKAVSSATSFECCPVTLAKKGACVD